MRTGDSTKAKLAQKKKLPQILITTPESIHVMLSNKGFDKLFKNLRAVVVDEWHELLGSGGQFSRTVLIKIQKP